MTRAAWSTCKSAIAPLVIGGAVLLMSCSRGDSKPPGTAPAIETSTEPTLVPPTVDPKAPTEGPPPANYPPPRMQPSQADQATLATDPLVVYADEVASTHFNGRSWPVIEIVSYNLRTHRVAGLVRVGAVGEYPYVSQSSLAGRAVVVNLERRVITANLDGTGMRTLFRASDGAVVTSIAMSPDGRTVAIGTESADLTTGPLAFLAFVDVASGHELMRIGADVFTQAGFRGPPGINSWRTDRAVEVHAVSHKGGGVASPLAMASVDGKVEMLPQPSLDFAAGRYAGVPSRTLFYGCQGSWQLPTTVELFERGSSLSAGMLARDGFVVEFNRASPDGRSILFTTHRIQAGDRPGGQCFDVTTTGGWQVWSAAGLVNVADLRVLFQSWYGSRFVDLECEGQPIEMPYPLNETYLRCNGFAATPPANLLVGGENVGVVHEAAIVGFIEH